MDIYSRKQTWKIYMVIGGFLIMLIAMIYTFYLAAKLSEGEKSNVELLVRAYQEIAANEDYLEKDVNFAFYIIQQNTKIPIIVTDELDSIQFAVNFRNDKNENNSFLQKELSKIKRSGHTPINMTLRGTTNFLYYKSSRLLKLLTYFPLVMLLLLATFILFGYLGFSSSRKAEQNRVWVGMAKETAHQLGTPISAILAWIEYLKDLANGEKKKLEVIHELQNDVSRLELIADRFSKIGSAPNLEAMNIYSELNKSKKYMQRRASRNVNFDFPGLENTPLNVEVNSHLFSWVVENLLRNALDAMDGEGMISAKVTDEGDWINIDITDTGKGISASKLKTVFEPGYTTKKRGWGLGLSLAKRIIENYHGGKIFVKSSDPEHGTTFSIKLPKKH